MNKIKCPLVAYNQCNEQADLVEFGANTLSAKRGNKKYFIRCPVHGSLRFDKPNAQTVIKAAAGVEEKPVTEQPKQIEIEKPQLPGIKPEIEPETESKTMEEWGF